MGAPRDLVDPPQHRRRPDLRLTRSDNSVLAGSGGRARFPRDCRECRRRHRRAPAGPGPSWHEHDVRDGPIHRPRREPSGGRPAVHRRLRVPAGHDRPGPRAMPRVREGRGPRGRPAPVLPRRGSGPDLRASMPSRVVDEAWHEFITFTRAYDTFCQRAFGRFLHHEPEYLMASSEATANQTTVLRGTWRTACLSAGLDPDTTRTAPTLFAADLWAGIDEARTYVATCGSGDACTTSDDVVCVEHELRGPVQPEPSRRRRHARVGRRGDGGGGDGGGGDGGGDGGGEGWRRRWRRLWGRRLRGRRMRPGEASHVGHTHSASSCERPDQQTHCRYRSRGSIGNSVQEHRQLGSASGGESQVLTPRATSVTHSSRCRDHGAGTGTPRRDDYTSMTPSTPSGVGSSLDSKLFHPRTRQDPCTWRTDAGGRRSGPASELVESPPVLRSRRWHARGVKTQVVSTSLGPVEVSLGRSRRRCRRARLSRGTRLGGHSARFRPLHRPGVSGLGLLPARLWPHARGSADGGRVRPCCGGGLRRAWDQRSGRNRGNQLRGTPGGARRCRAGAPGASAGTAQLRSVDVALPRQQAGGGGGPAGILPGDATTHLAGHPRDDVVGQGSASDDVDVVDAPGRLVVAHVDACGPRIGSGDLRGHGFRIGVCHGPSPRRGRPGVLSPRGSAVGSLPNPRDGVPT